jgi:hypothetical protein
VIAKPGHTVLHYAITVLMAIIALAIGLLSLAHPVARWAYGEPRRSDAPGVWGVDILVVPVVLIGIGAARMWFALELDFEAWRQRRRHKRR